MKYKLSFSILLLILFIGVQLFFCNSLIESSAKHRVYDSIQEVPHKKVCLVLGTAKEVSKGRPNLYFKYRIEAAVALYKAGKVDFFVVSGDNSRESYDEPTDMKQDMVAAGIPESVIFCDFAGFRTLDSVVRMKKVFNEDDFIIVSQRFHIERALYLGARNNINAIGFTAQDVPSAYNRAGIIREKLARVKAVYDVCVFNTSPKFLGEQVEIK